MPKATKFILLASISLLLVLMGGFVSAAENQVNEVSLDEDINPEDLGVGDPKILPDSPFYFLKNWMRRVRGFIAFSPTAKAKLTEKLASEKLLELNKMVVKNKNANAINNAAQHYQDELDKMKSFTDRIRETAQESEQVGKFLDKFTQHQALCQRVLQKLEDQVPPEIFEKISQTRQEHLEKFKDVMLKLEDKNKIPQRLESNLQKIEGSKFKDFKNLELFEELTEKLPEDIQQVMEEKKEEILERLRQRLEELSPEEQKKLKNYLDNISGNNLKKLYVLSSLEGIELSEKLSTIVGQARERNIEKIKNQYQEVATEEKAENKISEAESSLTEAKAMVVEKNIQKEEIPSVFRLLELSAEKLAVAEQAFEEEAYGNTFGQATASLSLSKNAIRIMEIRAGFGQAVQAVCSNLNFPVCGKDGKTYQNICEAKKSGVKIAYRGECKTELPCAQEGQRVNRNPLIGVTSQACCEDLEEIRVTKTYSVCKKPGVSFECRTDSDCPLPRCPGVSSQCVDGKCIVPRCPKPSVCIQVITPAKNPTTSVCREFPTPCDVPEGWIIVPSCPNLRFQLEQFLKGKTLQLQR